MTAATSPPQSRAAGTDRAAPAFNERASPFRARPGGITVIPGSDTADMGTQLRLVKVDTPATRTRARRAEPTRRGRRAVHWPDWRLDDRARHVGRAGVAQARAALARAQNPDPEAPLHKAS